MPSSFDAYILAPPSGFLVGCRALNRKFETQLGFEEMVRSGIDIVKLGHTCFDIGNELQSHNARKVVTYLTTAWLSSTPTPSAKEVAISLDLNSALSRDVIEAFVTLYSEIVNVGQMNQLALEMKLGKFEALAWKIGVAVGSNKCTGYFFIIFNSIYHNHHRSHLFIFFLQ